MTLLRLFLPVPPEEGELPLERPTSASQALLVVAAGALLILWFAGIGWLVS